MITIAVCDDDAVFSKMLAVELRRLTVNSLPESLDCRVTGCFNSGKDVIDYLENNTINILFLDVEMKDMNGFELASVLRCKYPDMLIIFVSAYENHVFSSFAYAPFRFLRKSHIDEELGAALTAAVGKIMADHESAVFSTVDGQFEIRYRDISYFESARNYVLIHTRSGKTYKTRSTLSQIVDKIDSRRFCMIHKSFFVNLENIRRVDGICSLTLNDGTSLMISTRRAQQFKKAYMDFLAGRLLK